MRAEEKGQKKKRKNLNGRDEEQEIQGQRERKTGEQGLMEWYLLMVEKRI